MNVAVIGTGYVGLVTGACFSEFGVQVTCVDTLSVEKIETLEREARFPIYEPGLDEIVGRNRTQAGRLSILRRMGSRRHRPGIGDLHCRRNASLTEWQHRSPIFVEEVAREIGKRQLDSLQGHRDEEHRPGGHLPTRFENGSRRSWIKRGEQGAFQRGVESRVPS